MTAPILFSDDIIIIRQICIEGNDEFYTGEVESYTIHSNLKVINTRSIGKTLRYI
jgi:hypothetical protein